LSRDFTIEIYKELLDAFISEGYTFQTYRDFILAPAEKVVILRHDVDDRKLHSLNFARIQNQLGIKATYYFRVVPESFDSKMMKEIESMGHEVGLHYEEMDLARGDREKAYELFLNHLKTFRAIVNVKTICMHVRDEAIVIFKQMLSLNEGNFKLNQPTGEIAPTTGPA
jgi:hypothetical protein